MILSTRLSVLPAVSQTVSYSVLHSCSWCKLAGEQLGRCSQSPARTPPRFR